MEALFVGEIIQTGNLSLRRYIFAERTASRLFFCFMKLVELSRSIMHCSCPFNHAQISIMHIVDTLHSDLPCPFNQLLILFNYRINS